jgi:DNA-directed RNA polymerase omega subunit
MAQYLSRGTDIDTDKCVAHIGNRFNLVILAAARSREIRRQNHGSHKFEHIHTNVTALLEFQSGELDIGYMQKIKFNEPRDRAIDRRAQYK